MHLWRGMEVTDGLVVTTDAYFTNRNRNFQFGLWGGANVNGNYKEFDYYISYTFHRFSLSLWDIYNFSPDADHNNKEIFNYKAKETGRFIDATVAYTFCEKFPLLLSWSTILFGRDRDRLNTKNRYSTFAYAEYPVWKNEKWEVRPGVGAAFALSPGKGLEGEPTFRHFYGNKAGIVHLSLTTVYQFSAFNRKFPITILTLWNPQSNEGYLQAGIQLLSF